MKKVKNILFFLVFWPALMVVAGMAHDFSPALGFSIVAGVAFMPTILLFILIDKFDKFLLYKEMNPSREVSEQQSRFDSKVFEYAMSKDVNPAVHVNESGQIKLWGVEDGQETMICDYVSIRNDTTPDSFELSLRNVMEKIDHYAERRG